MTKIQIKILVILLTFSQLNQEILGQASDLTIIEGSIGIITTSSKYKFGDTISILNDQGHFLKPIVITNEYQILDARVISINNDYYRIRLSDSTNCYLSKLNPLILFQTWEEHILSVFSVSFSITENPIRKNPSSSSDKIPYEKDRILFARKN